MSANERPCETTHFSISILEHNVVVHEQKIAKSVTPGLVVALSHLGIGSKGDISLVRPDVRFAPPKEDIGPRNCESR